MEKVDCRQILLHLDEVAYITRHGARTVERNLPIASKIGKCKMYALSDVINHFAPDRPRAAQRLLVDALMVIRNARPPQVDDGDE